MDEDKTLPGEGDTEDEPATLEETAVPIAPDNTPEAAPAGDGDEEPGEDEPAEIKL